MNPFLQTKLTWDKSLAKACLTAVVAVCFMGVSYAEKHGGTAPKTTVKTAAITVTGNVKDAAGQPIPGANVIIKGSKVGTFTNGEGNFKIDVPKGNEILVISSVGYKVREVAVNGQTNINLTLDDDVASISEVVVVGYGSQKKVSLTGAVAAVDMKAIQELPVGSLSAALQGQMPGVGVSGGMGRPGDNAQLTVRNPIILSKDGGTLRPLFVIDNVVRTEDDFNLLDVCC